MAKRRYTKECRILKPAAIGCLAFFLWGQGSKVDAQDLGNLIQNGGFETQTPSLPIPPNPPGPPTGSYFRQIDASQVPPWSTSASDNKIELWSSGYSASSGGPVFSIAPGQSTAAGDVFFPAGGGNFFAELNATRPSTLSQTVTLGKTGILSYSFWHRGRAGLDTMKLDVQELKNGVWTTVHSDTYQTGQTWTNYVQKNILIGESGQQYRFAYTAVSTATGNLSIGNFIDNAAFGLLEFPQPEPELPDPFEPPITGELMPEQVADDLSNSFAATLSPQAIVSGFFPRNTDAAPAGIQRMLNDSAMAVLNSTMDVEPLQIPLCQGSDTNPRRYIGAEKETAQAKAECIQRPGPKSGQSSDKRFTFADQPNDFYGERRGLRAWLRGFSSSLTNIDNPGLGSWVNRADIRGGASLFGLEKSLSPSTQLGVYGSVGSLSVIQTGNGGGNWSPTAYGAGLYGRWSPGPYFIGALAGYGTFSGGQTRGIQLDSSALSASGQKSADSFTAAMVAGGRFNLSRNTLLTPSLNLSWSGVHEHGFGETGGELSDGNSTIDVFNLQYLPHNTSWTNLDLGVSIAQTVRSGTTLIVPSARLSWFGTWKTGGGDQMVDYPFSTRQAEVPGAWLNRSGLRVALGMNVATRDNLSLYLRGVADFGYDSRQNGALADYGLNGGITIQF
jgi:hypothetical protein